MNIVAVTVGASALFIPLALLYRILNPAKVKPVEATPFVPSGLPYIPGLNYCHLFPKPAPSKPTEQETRNAHYAACAAREAAKQAAEISAFITQPIEKRKSIRSKIFAPSYLPSEEEIFRAEVLKRLK